MQVFCVPVLIRSFTKFFFFSRLAKFYDPGLGTWDDDENKGFSSKGKVEIRSLFQIRVAKTNSIHLKTIPKRLGSLDYATLLFEFHYESHQVNQTLDTKYDITPDKGGWVAELLLGYSNFHRSSPNLIFRK